MKTGTPGVGTPGVGDAVRPFAKQHIGVFAGLLAELREMTPKHLRKIETQVAEFHLAQEAAEKAQHDAEHEQHKVELAQQELGVREHNHNGQMEQDLDALNRREVNVKQREDDVKHREISVTTREQTVDDAERRIETLRDNIDSVGGAVA